MDALTPARLPHRPAAMYSVLFRTDLLPSRISPSWPFRLQPSHTAPPPL